MTAMITKNFSILRLIAYIVLGLFLLGYVISTVYRHVETQNRLNMIEIMANFHHVDAIVISSDAYQFECYTNDRSVDELKELFDPFRAGRIGMPRGTRRSLQNQAIDQLAVITYKIQSEVLFTATIYLFEYFPLPEQFEMPGSTSRNVFRVGNYYAVVFINNGNFMGSFEFHTWPCTII